MATQPPSAPPNPTDENSKISEDAQPTAEVQQDAKPEAARQISPKSVFVNSEPIREEQVQNAVKFLSHPRVRGSPVIHRRSFLERKGLTKEEIDEAFRRVPDPPPSTQGTGFIQEGQKTSSNVQPQSQTHTLQPVAAAPVGVNSSPGLLSKSRFHWYHAVIAGGVLAASGAGAAVLIKNSVIPRLKSWVRRVVLEEDETEPSKKADAKLSLAEEVAAAAKAAAAAASDVARTSQEMMNTRTEEKRYFEEFVRLLDEQVQEIKSMSNSIRKLEGQTNNTWRTYMADQEDYEGSFANSRIMQMARRGEKTSSIREINDLHPNPSQLPSNPRIAPSTKPWGSSSDNGMSYQLDSESSAPWWQRKNPRITEIENESAPSSTNQSRTNERPPVQQRTWVPPQPPSVAMVEAAEAIRLPKPGVKIDQGGHNNDDQAVTNSSGAMDELRRITKVSEVEINGDGKGLGTSEIQEEQEQQYSQERSA